MIETKFKDTEVGRIPESWEAKHIKDICDVKRGVRVTRQILNPTDIYPVYQNTDYPMGFYSKYNVEANIPFVIVGGSAGLIGRSPVRYWAADDCAYFTNLNGISKDFLYYELLFRHLDIKKEVRTASIPRLDRSAIEKLVLGLPPISEQTRIATALSNIDALISELGKLIEKKRAIKQGAMQQLLTGKKRLRGFSEPWVETTLGEHVLFLRTGLNPRVHFKLNTPDADCFYITVRELQGFDIITGEQTDKINHSAVERIDERSRLKIGDVLFSGTGTIGQTALVKEKPNNWGIKEGIYAITPNSKTLDSSFLIYYLHTTYVISLFSSMSSGSTINSIPMGKLLELPLRLPSLSEQSAIASVLSSMDEEISSLEAKREKYVSIKQGMMQQLLTGTIRLL